MIQRLLRHNLNQNNNNLWLVFLRCSVAALTLINFTAIQFDFSSIFSANAFIPPDINDVLKNPLIPSIYSIAQFAKPLMSYEAVLLAFRVLYPLALLLLLTGMFTRFSALLSLVLQLILLNSMDFYTYGLDEFTTIALFYCFIFPTGNQFSFDAHFFKKRADTTHYNKYLLLFRVHVCIAYFFSGFEKLLGYNWRNGESIWKMLHGYNMLSFVDLDFLYKTPIFLIAGWATIFLEMLYPIFMNIEKTRKYWLIGIIGFHVFIAFFMGLYFFSCMMIILNVTAYYIPYPVFRLKTIS
ncbi:HTTM domain-containing protein [Mucilaginibacter gilvus]|uniref:HTTM-like domain-containing protein n=1 Tax=Mucilaginibacter gilvus TaxID=2305909 RepID=A0A3S4YFI8_9SPHI|nr:HTTM domain-containing protein [Mucilaginibacter gilvus]RWY54072.1 hypothetical protein EPL05_08480 [Mucilaginibacter gilvus]